MSPYIPLILLFIVSTGFMLTMLVLSSVLGPVNRTKTKQLPFECGAVSVGSVREQRFNVRFYLVAMLFILFDIEVVFLYPWVLVLRDLGWPAYTAMASFMGVLGLGLVYVWKKGVLDWNRS